VTRLEQLLEFLNEDPKDPFNIYAVALEYQKTDTKKALEFFELLLRDHEDYIPTYYHAGKLFVEMEELEKAKQVFRKGIDISESRGDENAFRELRNAYAEIEFD
jgi:tetratricopeptide (TPR) repeat protein